MNHEIKWEEREIYDLMFEKMCLKDDSWEDMNYPDNKRREKNVIEKFNQIKNWANGRRIKFIIPFYFLFFIFSFSLKSHLPVIRLTFDLPIPFIFFESTGFENFNNLDLDEYQIQGAVWR